MALFDRDNYDRDFGERWGGSPEYGGRRGGGFMGAVRRGMDRARDAFDRDDDRGWHGHGQHHDAGSARWRDDRSRGWSGPGMDDARSASYDRDFRGSPDDHRFQGTGGGGEIGRGGDLGYRGTEPGWSTAFNYDRDYNYGRPWRGGGYDRDFGARRGMMGGGRMDYDRDMGMDRDRGDWRSRSQTDAGDPFGDRQRHTPFRMLRGGFDRWETDRGDWGRGDRLNRLGREARYDDVDYRGWNQGIGDDPIYNASDFRRNRNRF